MRCFDKVIQWCLLTLLQQTLDAGDCSAEPGYLGTGHNVPGSTPSVQVDSDGCAIQCGQVEGCAFWTFDLRSRYCWLKTSDAVKGDNTETINFLWGGPCTRTLVPSPPPSPDTEGSHTDKDSARGPNEKDKKKDSFPIGLLVGIILLVLGTLCWLGCCIKYCCCRTGNSGTGSSDRTRTESSLWVAPSRMRMGQKNNRQTQESQDYENTRQSSFLYD